MQKTRQQPSAFLVEKKKWGLFSSGWNRCTVGVVFWTKPPLGFPVTIPDTRRRPPRRVLLTWRRLVAGEEMPALREFIRGSLVACPKTCSASMATLSCPQIVRAEMLSPIDS